MNILNVGYMKLIVHLSMREWVSRGKRSSTKYPDTFMECEQFIYGINQFTYLSSIHLDKSKLPHCVFLLLDCFDQMLFP